MNNLQQALVRIKQIRDEARQRIIAQQAEELAEETNDEA